VSSVSGSSAVVLLLRWAHAPAPGRNDCPLQSGRTSSRAPWLPARQSSLAGCTYPTSAGRPRGTGSKARSTGAAAQTKPTRFIDGVHFRGLALKFSRPMHKCFLLETQRRLGIGAARLHGCLLSFHSRHRTTRACALRRRQSRRIVVAPYQYFLFSGSLYLMALTNLRRLGAVTPLGGLCFLAGWAWLIIAPSR
jgi:Protein of unknown function (DUF423)